MQGKQTGNEGIASPGGHHVAVEEGAESSPEHRAKLQRLDPEVEGKDEQEYSNGFVVVAASHRARDVARRNPHEGGSEEASRRGRRHLICQKIGGNGSETGEARRKEDADIPDIHRDGEGSERMVYDTTGHHEARVEGASGHTAQGVPCPVVEPVPKVVEAVRDKVLGRSEVEPRVDCSNVSIRSSHARDGLETDIHG